MADRRAPTPQPARPATEGDALRGHAPSSTKRVVTSHPVRPVLESAVDRDPTSPVAERTTIFERQRHGCHLRDGHSSTFFPSVTVRYGFTFYVAPLREVWFRAVDQVRLPPLDLQSR